jgi:lysophospholipid acyltransferase
VRTVKLIFSFLLSYPLAGVLKRIPDSKPWQKNVFIVGVSMFYLVGLFDMWTGLQHLLASAVAAYAIAAYVQGPFMPWVGFVVLMGHMSISHIYRQIVNDPGIIDVTGAQMVLVMKLTAFCWNVHDGKRPDSELSEFQKERCIRKLPDLLDYAAYVFFFPALFAGPAFDYVDYQRWISTSMFELPPGTDPMKAPPTRKKRKIPRSGTPAAFKAVFGLGWIFLFLNFAGWYQQDFLLGPGYMKYGFLRRVFYLHMFNFTTRLKYYGVWSLTEGACILAGIGYRGIDPATGKPAWDRLQNVKPFAIEFAQNSFAYLGNWNINTNLWLRNYVYLRVTPKGKKPGFRATLATFVTSAFWHGFYPGYYLTFVLASFIQHVAKNSRRLLRPFFMTPDGSKPTPYKRYYDIFCYVVTQLAFSFTTTPFIVLTLPGSVLIWARVYFYTIVGVAASLGFLASPAKGYLIKQQKKRIGAAGRPDMKRMDSTDKPPTLGLPDDPQKEVDEIFEELKAEIEARRKSGEKVDMGEVKKAVEDKLGKKID